MGLFIVALPSDKRGRMPPSSRSRHQLDYLIRSCYGHLDHHGYHHNLEQHQHLVHQVANLDNIGLLDLSRGAIDLLVSAFGKKIQLFFAFSQWLPFLFGVTKSQVDSCVLGVEGGLIFLTMPF